jgi:hypothetical protein
MRLIKLALLSTLTTMEQQSDHPTAAKPAKRDAVLLTCSIARDADLFGLLAASIDRHVGDEMEHQVVVPWSDLAAFRKYQTRNRTIIAQEDLLPVKLWKLPAALRHLSYIKAGFRRPLYLTSDRNLIRGWMLQQLLKISISAQSERTAIMHVDSDVCFFRDFKTSEIFDGNNVRFFRALGATRNPMHRPWIEAASRFLGIDPPQDYHAHYVENCVVWRTDLVRAMIERIEAANETEFHKALFGASTISEYYLYGIFADLVAKDEGLNAEDTSFCNSYWPNSESEPVDIAKLAARQQPKHCALSVQSTHKLSLVERTEAYEQATREMTK